MMNKNYQKRSEVSRKNAKIALQRGEKARAKNYLIQYKQYSAKIDRINNMRSKIERSLEAVEEGTFIAQTGGIMGGIRDELKDIVVKAAPERVAEIAEDTEQYVAEIEEAAEILAGDPEIDLGLDVTDELNQLETEMLLETSGAMPEVPGGELQYISEYEELDAEPSNENIESEIEKLRKELESS